MMENDVIELSQEEPVSMADEWFEIASESHFWMRWRYLSLKRHEPLFLKTGNKVLEVGCGNGIVLNQLEKYSNIVADGCDLNSYALKKIRNASGKVYLYNIYDLNPGLLGKYDSVILLDVIEHIDDDVDFLKTACQHLTKKGCLVINVPALPWLFSKYDHQAGHKRRYNKKMIHELFAAAGLELLELHYWGFSLLPIALVRKYLLKLIPQERVIKAGFQPPLRWVNKALISLMKLESSLLKSPPAGTSLIAIGRIWK